MSAYKKLNKQDVYISTYAARKSWAASGSVDYLYDAYGIRIMYGFSGSAPYYNPNQSVAETLTWRSLQHLYYSLSDEVGQYSGSFDNYFESSLISGSRNLQDEVVVISIPQRFYGVRLEPNTVVIKPGITAGGVESNYVTPGYVETGYVESIEYAYGSSPFIDCSDWTLGDPLRHRIEIVDDGEGNLIYSGSNLGLPCLQPYKVLGNVIYSHGLLILTDLEVIEYYRKYIPPHIRWKSNHPIYTYNAHCKVKDTELIYTLNPSARSGSFGDIAANVSGDEFQPYVTTVGLYNDVNELIAVAKLGKPFPKSRNTDMTFVVKVEI